MDKVNVSGRDNKFKGRWDGTNYSFEREGNYGFSWPPRNYNCTFCKKEFKSAQALGGHMNVHRRDRAKQLTQQHSSSSSSSEQLNTTSSHLPSNPNPKPNLNHDYNLFLSPSHTSSPATRFLTYMGCTSTTPNLNNAVSDQDDGVAVSPQIREIRKKLAVEANYNRSEFKVLMKQEKSYDESSRVHKKKNNQFLGLDLNMATTGRDGNDDLDLELRLGSF